MSWPEIQARFRDLYRTCVAGGELGPPWRAYRETVLKADGGIPYHLIAPLKLIEDAAARRGRENVLVFDHGCGGASTLLYLLVHGYTGIHGVDVGGNCTSWNRLLHEEFGIKEQRFFIYDGNRLPFDSERFDVLISEEVVEHVPEGAIANYYAEGARVLRPDGLAYFTVPHRLGPYDSHTRTWFVHYLPRSLALAVYDGLNKDRSFVENHLFLRSPRFHQQMLQKLYRSSADVTQQRLMTLVDFEYYDGSRRLRQWIGALARVPVLGSLIQLLAGALLMRQTVSRKQAGPLPAIYG